MNEARRMIEAAGAAEGPAHLATVVEVEGSAYRRAGARMLMLAGGGRIGAISGGCLERDLCRAAPWLTRDGPRVVSFDTRDETEDGRSPYNLGCSGIIRVLVERVTGDAACPLRHLRAVLENGAPQVVATVYHAGRSGLAAIGTRMSEPELAGRFPAIAAHATDVRASGGSLNCELVEENASCRLLLERIDPPRPLWIFGAGDDARPLCAMAAQLGWDVTVVDKQPGNLEARSFADARHRLCVHPSDAAAHLVPDRRTAAVLMTHSFSDDTALLPWLLSSGAGYVGLLGPRSRTVKVMRRLQEAGRLPAADALDRLHTPVGLDLGGSTPPEIALAILAEIVACDHARGGGRLQAQTGPIHRRTGRIRVDGSMGARGPASDPAVVAWP